MVKIVPYLNLPNAKKGIELYEKMFDAKVVSHQPFSKEMAPPGLPDDFDFTNSTMHAELELLGTKLYMSDSMGKKLSPVGMVDILLEFDNEKDIKRVYEKAKELGSHITMELNKTFWNAWYANLKDPLGITWQLNYQMPPETQESPSEAPKDSSASKESSKKPAKKTEKKKSTPKKSGKKTTKKKSK